MEFSPYTILNDSYIKGIYHFANFIQKRLCVFNKFNTYCGLVSDLLFVYRNCGLSFIFNGFRKHPSSFPPNILRKIFYNSCWQRQQFWYNPQEMNIEAILSEGKSLIFRAFQAFAWLRSPLFRRTLFVPFQAPKKYNYV